MRLLGLISTVAACLLLPITVCAAADSSAEPLADLSWIQPADRSKTRMGYRYR